MQLITSGNLVIHIYSHTSPFAYSVKNNSMKGSLNWFCIKQKIIIKYLTQNYVPNSIEEIFIHI